MLRLVHHMARSGGTLFSRCLGCMSGVLLLSEIHPLGTAQFNPLVQAQRWYGLLSSQDLAELRARGRIAFVDAIDLIHRRADEAGQRLVIRDWSHLDFTGVPFVANPAYRLLTAEALASRFELRQVCTVRHPLDQWLSLRQLAVVHGKLTLEAFLAGYRRFAEQAQDDRLLPLRGFRSRPEHDPEGAVPSPGAALRSPLHRALVELCLGHRRRRGQPQRLRHPAAAPTGGGTRFCSISWPPAPTTARASSCSATPTRARAVPDQRRSSRPATAERAGR